MLFEITEILGNGKQTDGASKYLSEQASKKRSTEASEHPTLVGSTSTRMEPIKMIQDDHAYVKYPEVETYCTIELNNTTVADNNAEIILDNFIVCDNKQCVVIEPSEEIYTPIQDSENKNIISTILQEVGITCDDDIPIECVPSPNSEQDIDSDMEDSLKYLLEGLGDFINHDYIQVPHNISTSECSDHSQEVTMASPLICAGTTCKTLENLTDKQNRSRCSSSMDYMDSSMSSLPLPDPFDHFPYGSSLNNDDRFESNNSVISGGSLSPRSVDLMTEGEDLWQESFVELFPTLSF